MNQRRRNDNYLRFHPNPEIPAAQSSVWRAQSFLPKPISLANIPEKIKCPQDSAAFYCLPWTKPCN